METPSSIKEPCTKFKGKCGNPIFITAQVPFTSAVEGKLTSVPVFIQPDSEQECLSGSNALHFSVVARSKLEDETASVNLVQTKTLLGLNGCIARAKVNVPSFEGNCLLFEPDHRHFWGACI